MRHHHPWLRLTTWSNSPPNFGNDSVKMWTGQGFPICPAGMYGSIVCFALFCRCGVLIPG